MDLLVGQLFTGLSTGSILLLAALGLSLTFGQMGVINMAHGEFIMAGCYTAYVTQQVVGDAGASLLIALPIGFLVGGTMGLVLEWLLIRHLYHRPLDTLLVTFGVGLVLQQVARDVFGAPAVNVTVPESLRGGVELLGTTVPKTRLFIMALAIVAVTAVTLVLRFTPAGRRIRAVVGNRDLAETAGISSRRGRRRDVLHRVRSRRGRGRRLDAHRVDEPDHRAVVPRGRVPRGRRRRPRPHQGRRGRRDRARRDAGGVRDLLDRVAREGRRLRRHRGLPPTAPARPVHAADKEPRMSPHRVTPPSRSLRSGSSKGSACRRVAPDGSERR